MPKLFVQLVAALTWAGLSLGNLATAPAQQSGNGTNADTRPEPITEAETLPAPGEETGSADSTDSTDAGYVTGYQGGYAAPYLPGGGRRIRWDDEWYGYQNQGPWMRPIRRPLNRVPVQYARYWPRSYYTGSYNPRARYARPLPMVYQPTDTTQLGFYHQRVPQWQPRPNAIPRAPWPPNWHYRIPTRFGTYNNASAVGYGYGAGYGYGSGSVYGQGFSTGGDFGSQASPEDAQPTPTDPPAKIEPDQDAKKAEPAAAAPKAPQPE